VKKLIAVSTGLILLAFLFAGCSSTTNVSHEAAEKPAVATETPPQTPEPVAATEAPAATEEPTPANAEDTDEDPDEARGHYIFQPKVCSSYMTELFGETMTETWFNLVDAVMAGEDTFACPDKDTYNWVMGQFPDKCFPILPELIDYCYDRNDPVKDGMGSFVYLVSPEDAAARISEFAALVEDILNDTLKDDYSDMEKALALYIYFSHHYVYDYEAANPEIYADYLSSYRVLTTGNGICQEFSVAYSYLLLQVGVDATNMSGHRSYDDAPHQWSYVRINGHNYHIDPTYVINDVDSLSYFMMSDDQRELADSYLRNNWIICSNYAQDHPHPDYTADDDSFEAIWEGRYVGFDHRNQILTYDTSYDPYEPKLMYFNYAGW